MLSSMHSPHTFVEQYFSNPHQPSLQGLWFKLSQPCAYIPILTVTLSMLYFSIQSHLARNRNMQLSPLELFLEAGIYFTPGVILCTIDDLLNPSLFPRSYSERAGSHVKKRKLASRLLNQSRAALALPRSSLLTYIFTSVSELTTTTMPKLPDSVRPGNRNAPVGLYNTTAVQCYQNAVLQALGTVTQLTDQVAETIGHVNLNNESKEASVAAALADMVHRLRDPENMGAAYQTPKELCLLDQGDQQDAQEYYVHLVEAVLKDVGEIQNKNAKGSRTSLQQGTPAPPMVRSTSAESQDSGYESVTSQTTFPVTGLLAHRVTCDACGHTEGGLKLEEFSNLSIQLCHQRGRNRSLLTEMGQLFDIEEIEGGRCNKCIVNKYIERLRMLRDSTPGISNEIVARIESSQALINGDSLLDEDLRSVGIDFTKIKARVTKTKQTCIARPPRNLVFYIGRTDPLSLFKIRDRVEYPETLDISPWVLGSVTGSPPFFWGDITRPEEPYTPEKWFEMWPMGSRQSMISGRGKSAIEGPVYKLSAVVVHKGTVSTSGHYTCLRREPALSQKQWWELSDRMAHPVGQSTVLGNPNAVMVFYECSQPVVRHRSAVYKQPSGGVLQVPAEYLVQSNEVSTRKEKAEHHHSRVFHDDSGMSCKFSNSNRRKKVFVKRRGRARSFTNGEKLTGVNSAPKEELLRGRKRSRHQSTDDDFASEQSDVSRRVKKARTPHHSPKLPPGWRVPMALPARKHPRKRSSSL